MNLDETASSQLNSSSPIRMNKHGEWEISIRIGTFSKREWEVSIHGTLPKREWEVSIHGTLDSSLGSPPAWLEWTAL
jgi:hypothetical protein